MFGLMLNKAAQTHFKSREIMDRLKCYLDMSYDQSNGSPGHFFHCLKSNKCILKKHFANMCQCLDPLTYEECTENGDVIGCLRERCYLGILPPLGEKKMDPVAERLKKQSVQTREARSTRSRRSFSSAHSPLGRLLQIQLQDELENQENNPSKRYHPALMKIDDWKHLAEEGIDNNYQDDEKKEVLLNRLFGLSS